jgi:hypothetical protein
MRLRQAFEVLGAMAALLGVACAGEVEGGDSNATDPSTPGAGTSGSPAGGAAAAGMTGGMQGSTGGRPGIVPMSPGGAGGAGAAGTVPGTSGMSGGAPVAGMPATGGVPAEEPPDAIPELDCGPNGVVIENAGPASNRVNYVIIGDGYSESELETTFIEHIEFAMGKRFSAPIGEPYLRYRKFVNICAVKIASSPICGNSALGCCGDDQSRLANCDRNAAISAMEDNFQNVADFNIDWTAVVLNGDSWWNTGSSLMLWSGGNENAHGAALHEGGHGFHQLADEYGGCTSSQVNVTSNDQTSGGKWDLWIGHMQEPGTGLQDFWQCEGQDYRSTDNSMMNLLFGDDPNTSYNSVSREKMVMDIWRFVEPIDSAVPEAGAVSGTTVLRVNVIDPEVIDVDWSVDGTVVEADGGAEFDVGAMGPGTYEVEAFAYDNAGEDLVRYREGGEFGRMNWERSRQRVTWTVTVP